MNKQFLGVDLGTSAVKVLIVSEDGEVQKSKAKYDEISPRGWKDGLVNALKKLDTSGVCAVGLSSQVGTYIADETEVISWNEKAGSDELAEIKNMYSKERFVKELSMNQPDIISYPLPRLMHIKRKNPAVKSICQPKDYICREMTGRCVTDKYSWRGLANNESGEYSKYFLTELDIPKKALPEIVGYTEKAGVVTQEFAKISGLAVGTEVYIGMNDFYCSLLGMGILNPGDMFDITGTSEHLGVIENKLNEDTKMVSSPYFDHYVHYGVTASSGVSMDFGMDNFGFDNVCVQTSIEKAPVFLPYLNGERAPVFDADARGVFFGIQTGCTNEDLAYSVLEGNVFSLFHIYESMGKPDGKRIIAGGGASKDSILNGIKAEMFNMPVLTLKESDTSALGAAMTAAVGNGTFDDFNQVVDAFCRTNEIFKPTCVFREKLLSRYEIYKGLYPSLKDNFKKFTEGTK